MVELEQIEAATDPKEMGALRDACAR